MTKKLYELTDEHRAQLKPWAEKWIRNALSTQQMTEADRAEARIHIRGLYEAAGLKPPPNERIVFVRDPFILRFAAGFAAWVWYERKNGKLKRQATDQATDQATEQATEQVTRQATRQATHQATYQATYQATDQATYQATRQATYQATHQATAVDTWISFPTHLMRSVAAEFTDNPTAALQCAQKIYNLWQGGNQWSAWDSYLSFFRHIAKLDLDYSKYAHWERLAEISGPRCLHEEFAIICDRPTILSVDEQNRPHSINGPFCQWATGTALYSVHGVQVPRSVIEAPHTLTAARITSERNAEVRRVMIERFGMGRYLQECGAVELHRDEFGVLYRKDLADDEPLVTVAVKNSTPEPDGSIKDYFLRVDPALRPMLANQRFGEPQELTARNAVASTFGLRGEDYVLERET